MKIMRTLVVSLAICMALASTLLVAQVGALVIQPTVDFRFRGINGTPFQDGVYLEAYLSAAGYETRSALEFALASVPEGAEITQATLTLFSAGGGSSFWGSTNLHGYQGDGAVALEDVTNLGPVLVNFTAVAQLNEINEVDIPVAFVNDLLANSASHAGLALSPNGESSAFWWQSENEDENLRPFLTLEYSLGPPLEPEPIPTLSEWGILLTGVLLGGFGILRLRRRNGSAA